MDIVTRLKIYMDHTGLQISQFADTASIPRPTLSQILSGRNKKISNEVLTKLHNAYPDLNIAWLLFGDGEMDLKGGISTNKPKTADTQPAPLPSEKPGLFETFAPGFTQSASANAEPEETSKRDFSEIVSELPESNKRIKSIVVLYSDSSYETFYPSHR